MKKSVCVLTALASFLVVSCCTNQYTKAAETEEVDDQPEAIVDSVLESERELKWMLKFVSPLMAILRTDWTINRRGHSNRSARSNRGDYYVLPYGDINHDRNRFHRDDYDRDGYGYGYGGGGGSYGCCDKKDDLLPLLALLALAGLLLYLIAIARKPVAARRSNKRSAESGIDEDSWIRSNDYNSGKAIP
ncbi:uncharacterized protein LOC123469381 [Daphnia magna]|uniref:uncharacterized protein LOC123469381 n=1 Tax=Daphnia magna TaxID=35525 RepID=UPI001E1BB234|nr:uncharacterized protein LOC123469381 [Daphnia magna]